MRRIIAALGSAVVVATLAGCQSPARMDMPQAPVFSEAFVAVMPEAQVAAMQRGVNVLGYDPVWNDQAGGRFTTSHFARIRQAGFATVRIVLQAFDHMDADGTLDPVWLAKLDSFTTAALAQNLTVILDEHDFNLCAENAQTCRTRLNAFWRQIAPRYKDAPSRLIFEILNEPNGAMTAAVWNKQLAESLDIIRASNPTRNVVIGPGHWNGMGALPDLVLPEADRHIIVTFHYYHPMAFTHQGASWTPAYTNTLGVTWGTPEDVKRLNDEMDTVKAWSVAQGRPIFLGEFGAYDKAAMDQRVKWDSAVARAAEARGFAWAYWQFDPDFVLWDFSKPGWVEPILHALIPPQGTNAADNNK